jgi:hypothetical protein
MSTVSTAKPEGWRLRIADTTAVQRLSSSPLTGVLAWGIGIAVAALGLLALAHDASAIL